VKPAAAKPADVKPAALLLDVCCVLAFVVIGRASHGEAASIAGLARTAWPFMSGLAGGLLVTRAWRRPTAIVPTGAGVWLAIVAIGMLLRVVSGQGTTFAFTLVALAFLGLFTLGWRVVARGAASVRAARLPG
jgi:Protein of unknown function (DUF3054)